MVALTWTKDELLQRMDDEWMCEAFRSIHANPVMIQEANRRGIAQPSGTPCWFILAMATRRMVEPAEVVLDIYCRGLSGELPDDGMEMQLFHWSIEGAVDELIESIDPLPEEELEPTDEEQEALDEFFAAHEQAVLRELRGGHGASYAMN